MSARVRLMRLRLRAAYRKLAMKWHPVRSHSCFCMPPDIRTGIRPQSLNIVLFEHILGDP